MLCSGFTAAVLPSRDQLAESMQAKKLNPVDRSHIKIIQVAKFNIRINLHFKTTAGITTFPFIALIVLCMLQSFLQSISAERSASVKSLAVSTVWTDVDKSVRLKKHNFL